MKKKTCWLQLAFFYIVLSKNYLEWHLQIFNIYISTGFDKCILSWNPDIGYFYQDKEHFHHPGPVNFYPSFPSQAIIFLHFSTIKLVSPILELHIQKIILHWYKPIPVRSIHDVCIVIHSSLVRTSIPLYEYITLYSFFCDGHFLPHPLPFWLLWIMTMNFPVHVFCGYVFIYLG